MSMMETFQSDNYPDGRTKQAFKDQTDINKILAQAAKGKTISHLARHGAVYGDFSDIDDLLVAHNRLKKGQSIFDQLPSEVRREFDNDLGKFFRFVNDPENLEKLPQLLPGLAKPGDQMAAPRRTATTVAAEDNAARERGEPVETPQAPQGGAQAPSEGNQPSE